MRQARVQAGYDEASRLRQSLDLASVLDWAPHHTLRILDLGCGTGTLLAQAFERFPALERAVGIDMLAARLDEAAEKLRGHGDKVGLIAADLTQSPEVDAPFDFIVMTSVLHWLYPHEDQVFRWISQQIGADGHFVLTTYHPVADADGLGGTDELVRQALQLLGDTKGAATARFAAHGVFPIARRTRSVRHLRALLSRHFDIDQSRPQEATMRAASGEAYVRYHAATFGTYYSQLAPPAKERLFFEALGYLAEERMRRQGYITSMQVRQWKCLPYRGGLPS